MAKKKDEYYFQHEFKPTSDEKIQAMLSDYGGLGYGIFWYIVELLHNDESHKLLRKKYIYKAIANQMSTTETLVSQFVDKCIKEYELFKLNNDGSFYSERVNKNIKKMEEISSLKSIAGKASAEKRKATRVEHVLTDVQQNPTK